MLPQYKKKSNVFVTLWLFGRLFGIIFSLAVGGGDLASLINILVWGLLIVGCVYFAKAKGYSGWWGALGLLSLVGLIILVCMKDRCKDK